MDGRDDQQRAIDAEVRATRRDVLATYRQRLRLDPAVLADEVFLGLADRHVVRTAIVVAGLGRGADACSLHTYDPIGGTLRIARHHGLRRPFLDRFARIDADTMLAGRPLLVDDLTDSPLAARDVLLTLGFRALHAYPLRDDRVNLLGMLTLHFRTPGARAPQTTLVRAASRALARVTEPPPVRDPFPAGRSGLVVTRIRRAAGMTVVLEGSLDARTVPECAATLAETTAALPAGHDLIVDLTHLDFLGVAGARTLLDAAAGCGRRGVPFHLVAGPDHDARMVFERLGVTAALSVLDASAYPIRSAASEPSSASDRALSDPGSA